MDFVQTIEFEEDMQPKLESKEELLGIKEEIDSTEVELEILSSAAKNLSSVRKEIVKMDFNQIIEPCGKFEAREQGGQTSKDFDHPLAKSKLIKSEVKTLVKSETIEMKTDLKTEIKQENLGEFEACEQVGIDFITDKDFKIPFVAKSELIDIKTEVKTEINEEPFEKYEAREQDVINFITSKDFDQNDNEPEFPTREIDFAVKRKIREEPNESNVPLKKFMQKGSVHQSMSMGEEFDTNLPSEKSNSDDENGDDLDFSLDEQDNIPDFDETVRYLPTVGNQLIIKTLSHTDFEKMLNEERLKNQMLQTKLDQVHQDHLKKNLSQEKSLTDLKEKNSILQQDISAQTEVIVEKMEIIENLQQNGSKERSHLSIRRENIDLKRSIKELEDINAVLSPAAKEVRKIRNALIAKIELGSREIDENEHEKMQKLDILSLLHRYDKKLTTSLSKKNETSQKTKNEESKVNNVELEKLRSKIIRLKAKNKKLKNKASTVS